MRLALAALAITLASAPAARADATPNAQQTLMKSCNADAASQHLAGPARKAFMSSCLAGNATPAATIAPTPAAMTPQQRMKSCAAQAGDQKLLGDSRKSFMSTCLKAG